MNLVSGGCSALNSDDRCTSNTDTTELLNAGAMAWVYTAPLPSARAGLRGASINNKIIISGHCGLWITTIDNVLGGSLEIG